MGSVVNGTAVKVKTGGQTNRWWVLLGSASIPRLTEHVLLPCFWLLLSSSFSSAAVVAELSSVAVAAHVVSLFDTVPLRLELDLTK